MLLHLINLPFHEAGHVFSPFGRFPGSCGTLGQWLVPFIVLCTFVVKEILSARRLSSWWLGESFSRHPTWPMPAPAADAAGWCDRQ
jgi:hypothetical protein